MTYSELKAAIAEVIKTNYNQEITAVVLQDLLDSMVGMTRAQDERVLGEARDYTDEREVVIREDFAAADAATLASAREYTKGAKEPSAQTLPQPMQKRCSPRKITQTPTR